MTKAELVLLDSVLDFHGEVRFDRLRSGSDAYCIVKAAARRGMVQVDAVARVATLTPAGEAAIYEAHCA